jgi:hypothetical protein
VFIRTHREAHWGCQSIGNPVTAAVMRADSSRGGSQPHQAWHLFILTTLTHPQGGILAYGPNSDWEQAAWWPLVTHSRRTATLLPLSDLSLFLPWPIMVTNHLRKFSVACHV